MLRLIALTSIGLGLVIAASGAQAQAAPTGPVPGSGDATKISQGTASSQSEYNHLIASGNAKQSATDERRPAKHSAAVAATAADIKPGSPLRDIKGVPIGTVTQVNADGVIVDTGKTAIEVPLVGFGKNDQGLLLNTTAQHFNELVANAQAAH